MATRANAAAPAESPRVAYKALRDWISALDAAGQLARVRAEVAWNCELAHITRRPWDSHGGASPALRFENTKGYPAPGPSKVFVGTFRSWYRTAMMLGLDPAVTTRAGLLRVLRERIHDRDPFLPPRVVSSGAVEQGG